MSGLAGLHTVHPETGLESGHQEAELGLVEAPKLILVKQGGDGFATATKVEALHHGDESHEHAIGIAWL